MFTVNRIPDPALLRDTGGMASDVVLTLVVPVCFVAAGVWGLFLGSPRRICWLTAGAGTAHVVALGLSSWAQASTGTPADVAHVASQCMFGVGFACLVGVAVTYPLGDRSGRAFAAAVGAAVVLPVLGGLAGASPPVLQDDSRVELGPVAHLLPAALADIGGLVLLLPVVAVGIMVLRYRGADDATRRALRWPALALAVIAVLACLGLLLGSALPAASDAVFVVAAPVFPLALVLGSAQRPALDVDSLARRTAVVGGSWVLVAAAYGAGAAASAWAATGRSLATAVILGGVASVLLARPVRRRLVDLADDRARLQDDLAERLVELEDSRARMASAADRERTRIERDLHDGTQQELLALLAQVEAARTTDEAEVRERALARAGELGQSVYETVRRVARDVRPAILDDLGLGPATAALAAISIVPIDLEDRTNGRRWPPEVEGAAYFVLAECLTNVTKHAAAERAVVALNGEGGWLHVEVRDNGVGGLDSFGHGLRGLQDRVGALGGRLEISEEDGWSRVLAVLPA